MTTLDQVQRTNVRHSGLDTLFNAAAHLIAELAASVRAASEPLNRSDFDRAERILAALPIGTDEYQVAMLQLHNGWQYNLAGETGAAAFELRQISNRIKR